MEVSKFRAIVGLALYIHSSLCRPSTVPQRQITFVLNMTMTSLLPKTSSELAFWPRQVVCLEHSVLRSQNDASRASTACPRREHVGGCARMASSHAGIEGFTRFRGDWRLGRPRSSDLPRPRRQSPEVILDKSLEESCHRAQCVIWHGRALLMYSQEDCGTFLRASKYPYENTSQDVAHHLEVRDREFAVLDNSSTPPSVPRNWARVTKLEDGFFRSPEPSWTLPAISISWIATTSAFTPVRLVRVSPSSKIAARSGESGNRQSGRPDLGVIVRSGRDSLLSPSRLSSAQDQDPGGAGCAATTRRERHPAGELLEQRGVQGSTESRHARQQNARRDVPRRRIHAHGGTVRLARRQRVFT